MVEIKDLVIQVPGLSAEVGKRFGEEVAQRLADRMPAHFTKKYIKQIDLKIPALEGTNQSQWANVVASSILKQIMEASR